MSARFSVPYFSSCYLSLLVVLALCHVCLCNQNLDDVLCMDGEKQALLQFKCGLVDEAGRLASWVENKLIKKLPKSFGNLCNLNDIDLSRNDFSNTSLPRLLENLFECKLPSLKSLSIYSSGLSGHLPNQVRRLVHVEHLFLHNNRITGVIPDSIGQLSFLRTLILSGNKISDPIPYSIGQLSLLAVLDISENQLNGTFSDSFIHLNKVEELFMSNNLLTGVVTEAHFAKLVNLKYLIRTRNNLTIRVRVANWTPPLRMQKLYLNSWNLGPQFPSWLHLLSGLREMDISNTSISSPMPESFLRSFPNLTHLHMSQNHIEGTLLGIPTSLEILDLRSNEFRGELPNLSNNSMSFLDLSENHFEGPLPKKFDVGMGNLSSLQLFSVRNNKLSGKIPTSILNLENLVVIDLAENEFSGSLPSLIRKDDTKLEITQSQIKQAGSMSIKQNMSEDTPYTYKVQVVSLVTKGREHEFSTTLFLVTTLDLSGNRFSGQIPEELMDPCGLALDELVRKSFDRKNSG
ncbi:leucine-rich repeat protein [Artemisia annua]|uniref:Leucine-rich repeat protein n=1 Tax=Artemisia annua TaxID=35608 RepID=A0A2U1KUK2_ARTAN|nr:leucine-rich repeat protein [Artemisia annua]